MENSSEKQHTNFAPDPSDITQTTIQELFYRQIRALSVFNSI